MTHLQRSQKFTTRIAESALGLSHHNIDRDQQLGFYSWLWWRTQFIFSMKNASESTMKRVLILVFTLAIAATSDQAAEIKGRARVVDGDTLWVGSIKIRLNGTDAPERSQPRYRAATQALQRLVAGKSSPAT